MAIRVAFLAALACSASALNLHEPNKWPVADKELTILASPKKEAVAEKELASQVSPEEEVAEQVVATLSEEMKPMPRTETQHGKTWMEVQARRAKDLQELENQTIVFYGDSIVEHWMGDRQGKADKKMQDRPYLWKRMFTDRYGASHLSGIGGDLITNLLWRLQNGESPKHAQPRLIMLQIGTNDLNFRYSRLNTKEPADKVALKIFEGYKKIVELFDKESPNSQILLTSIMPRGSEWPRNNFGKIIPEMNKLIESLADQKTIHFSDCSQVLLKDGKMDQAMANDYLHPSTEASSKWAECLQPTIDKILL